METTRFKRKIMAVFTLAGILLLGSCMKDPTPKPPVPNDYAGFDFETVSEYNVEINASIGSTPIKGAYIELYTINPMDADGVIKEDAKNFLLFKGMTTADGSIQCAISPPQYSDSLFALSYYLGLPGMVAAELSSEDISLDFQQAAVKKKKSAMMADLEGQTPTQTDGYYALGGWDDMGRVDYREAEGDVLSQEFLDDINASLPEYESLPESHPQYLAGSNDVNLVLIEDAELWLTFVHEGAGYHNVLAYYTYPTNDPPETPEDLTDITLVFPDASYDNNVLETGDKVQLWYIDPATGKYTATFPAGTSVGWHLISNGWSSGHVNNGLWKLYSNCYMNPETDESLKKHNVLLYDEERQLMVLGFEDILRDRSNCDQDFNDAVFYATASPITAIKTDLYQPIDDPTDTDGDGTSDVFDEFPEDPTRSFANHYPGEGVFGSLVYEDLWPTKGDYDFNDLVIDYNFSRETNAQNQVIAIGAKFVTRAIGASYHNAFAIEFKTTPSNVASVLGQELTRDLINMADNGTENGQTNAVVVMYDDAFNVLPYPGEGVCVNTYPQYPFVQPDTQTVVIELVDPVNFTSLGTPPYNPFIIVNQQRGVEVHLPGSKPTDLVDESLFGTGDDDTDLDANKYYVSDQYLPWAINLPESFAYPNEKVDIRKTHLVFDDWAQSMGFNYMDWYKDMPGYRDNNNIYSKD